MFKSKYVTYVSIRFKDSNHKFVDSLVNIDDETLLNLALDPGGVHVVEQVIKGDVSQK